MVLYGSLNFTKFTSSEMNRSMYCNTQIRIGSGVVIGKTSVCVCMCVHTAEDLLVPLVHGH